MDEDEDGEEELQSDEDPEVFMGFEEGYVGEGGEEEDAVTASPPEDDSDFTDYDSPEMTPTRRRVWMV